jgi:hypothetical protein
MGGCRQFRLVKDGKPVIVLILEAIPVYPDSMDMHEISKLTGVNPKTLSLAVQRLGADYLLCEEMLDYGRRIFFYPDQKAKEKTLKTARLDEWQQKVTT